MERRRGGRRFRVGGAVTLYAAAPRQQDRLHADDKLPHGGSGEPRKRFRKLRFGRRFCRPLIGGVFAPTCVEAGECLAGLAITWVERQYVLKMVGRFRSQVVVEA